MTHHVSHGYHAAVSITTNENRVNPTRIATALALVLFASACAQIPTADESAPERTSTPEQVTKLAEAEAPVAPAPPVTVEAPVPEVAAAPVPEPEGPPADLWVRIRKGFGKNDLDGRLVRQWEQWYSSRPDYVARMMDQASRFLFHVVEEVERRRMPSEIALLPMIESAFNPRAYSTAHASGIWQFIPATGRLYGLEQNFWYDGRRDIVAATSAALDYLEKLHGMFGNWDLALASYNWGEGAVQRAVARNQQKGLPADYESLRMPLETRHYLPKLQAVKNIVADPARFGLTLATIPNEPYFATVTTRQHIDVELAARLAGISVEEFRFLNPAHNKPVIKASNAEVIVLPRHAVERFNASLESHDRPLVSWQAYTVKPGDRLEKVAAKHGLSVEELAQINNLNGRNKFRTGLALMVPVKAGATPHLPNLPAPKVAKTRPKKPRYAAPTKKSGTAQKVAQGQAADKKKPAPATNTPAGGNPSTPTKIRVADAQRAAAGE